MDSGTFWNTVLRGRALLGRLKPLPLWIVRTCLAAGAIYYIGLFASFTLERIRYPGELEWMEGGILAHVLRVLDGKPLYAKPNLEFTAFIYTPFYYWLNALLGGLFGVSVSLLRSVSAASFLSSLVVIVLWTYRRYRSVLPGLVGAGLYAATFVIGGAWFDVARMDTLVVFLLLAAGLLLFTFSNRASAIASGLLFCLAFLTKQSALLPLLTVAGWAFLTRERRNVWCAGVALGSTLASWLLLHLASGGWFTYYVFTVPSAHPLLDDWVLLFWRNDVLGVLAIPALLLCLEAGASAVVPRANWKKFGFGAYCVGIILQVWSSRFHLGMFSNVLMPMHALMGLGTALTLARVQKSQRRYDRVLELVATLGLAGTLWNLDYPAEAQVPGEARMKQHENLMRRFKESPKGAWAPYHSVPTFLAGNPTRSHVMALIDIFRADPEQGARLAEAAESALSQHRYPAVFWSRDDSSTVFLRGPLSRYYRQASRLQGPAPLTGWGQNVTSLWIPKNGVPDPPAPVGPSRTDVRR